MAKNDLIVVVTSVGTEDQALDVAHALVRSRRAACVNIIPNVHSVYRWKGRVCDDGEMLLVIKTLASQFEAVRETIHKVNTYELPEVLGLPRGHGLAGIPRLDREDDGVDQAQGRREGEGEKAGAPEKGAAQGIARRVVRLAERSGGPAVA